MPGEDTGDTEDTGDGETPEKPSTDTPEPVDAFLPLEEVRDEIVKSMAIPKADELMREAQSSIREDLANYFQEYTVAKYKEKKLPKAPSAKSLANKYAGEGGETDLIDYLEGEGSPLGDTQRVGGQQFRPQMEDFDDFAFGQSVPMFSPMESTSKSDRNIQYLFWKDRQKASEIPKYNGAKEDVEDAWRTTRARKLAKKAAEKLVKQAKENSQALNLEGMLPELAEKIEGSGEFSWLSTSITTGGLELGSIAGVDGVTEETMEEVFKLKQGEVAVISNSAQSEFYVARVAYRGPTEKTLRIRFSMDSSVFPHAVQGDIRAYQQDLLDSIEKEFDVERFDQ